MQIKDLKLIPPSKRATAFLRNFIKEHDKGLKAIKTLAEIKEIAENNIDDNRIVAIQVMLNGAPDEKNKILKQILQKINEVENE